MNLVGIYRRKDATHNRRRMQRNFFFFLPIQPNRQSSRIPLKVSEFFCLDFLQTVSRSNQNRRPA